MEDVCACRARRALHTWAVAREDAPGSLRTTRRGPESDREERGACWVPWRDPFYPSSRGGGKGGESGMPSGEDGVVLAALPIQRGREAKSVNATLTPLYSRPPRWIPGIASTVPRGSEAQGLGRVTAPRGHPGAGKGDRTQGTLPAQPRTPPRLPLGRFLPRPGPTHRLLSQEWYPVGTQSHTVGQQQSQGLAESV